MNEEIIRVLQICLDSLATYGQHPIIESQVKQLMQKLQNDNSIPVEKLVMPKIAGILNELFQKYTEEKFSNYKHTEYYVGGLQDGKLIALAEIKERLSKISA